MECGIFHSILLIPMHLNRVGVRYSQKAIPHSIIQNSEIATGVWNFPFDIPHSNALQHDWSEMFSKTGNSRFHHPEFWNGIGMWIYIPQSRFQCTLARCGMRHSQKRQFHIPHSNNMEWMWNVGFSIPHSTFQCTLAR